MFKPSRGALAAACLMVTMVQAKADFPTRVDVRDEPHMSQLAGPDIQPAPAASVPLVEASGGNMPPSAAEQRWEVLTADVTLSKTLERWAASAGLKLKWDAARNFLIGAPDVYVGSFEGALHHLLSSPGIRYSEFPLEACIYANTPPLVRVTRQGEQSRECTAVLGLEGGG